MLQVPFPFTPWEQVNVFPYITTAGAADSGHLPLPSGVPLQIPSTTKLFTLWCERLPETVPAYVTHKPGGAQG